MNKYKLLLTLVLVSFMFTTLYGTHEKTKPENSKASISEEETDVLHEKEVTNSSIWSSYGMYISLGLFIVLASITITSSSSSKRQIEKLSEDIDNKYNYLNNKKVIINSESKTQQGLIANIKRLDQKYSDLDKSFDCQIEALNSRLNQLESLSQERISNKEIATVQSETNPTLASLFGAPEVGQHIVSQKVYSEYKTPFNIYNIRDDKAYYTLDIRGEEAISHWIKEYHLVLSSSVLFDEGGSTSPRKFQVIMPGTLTKIGENKWEIVETLKVKLV